MIERKVEVCPAKHRRSPDIMSFEQGKRIAGYEIEIGKDFEAHRTVWTR